MKASQIVLGTANFGLQYGVKNQRQLPLEVEQILGACRASGVTTIDTAIGYGESERILGKIGIADCNVITKLPPIQVPSGTIRVWIKDQLQQSLSRLGVKQLYGVLLHDPAQLLSNIGFAIYSGLEAAKQEGLVKKIGISIYEPSMLEKILRKFNIDIVQTPTNILDRQLTVSGWHLRLKAAGIEIHARSIFLQGLLLTPRTERPEKFRRWESLWNEWDRWLEMNNLEPIEGCLRYVESIPQIDKIIVGVDSVGQLQSILDSTIGSLDSLPCFPAMTDGRIVDPRTWGEL